MDENMEFKSRPELERYLRERGWRRASRKSLGDVVMVHNRFRYVRLLIRPGRVEGEPCYWWVAYSPKSAYYATARWR